MENSKNKDKATVLLFFSWKHVDLQDLTCMMRLVSLLLYYLLASTSQMWADCLEKNTDFGHIWT